MNSDRLQWINKEGTNNKNNFTPGVLSVLQERESPLSHITKPRDPGLTEVLKGHTITVSTKWRNMGLYLDYYQDCPLLSITFLI